MATMNEILTRIQSGLATSSDYEELAKLSKATAESHKKAEAQAKELIETIKKAEVDPKVLTNLLAKEGLIILPQSASTANKVVIMEEPVTTKEGRKSSFKIWKGREVNLLTADAKSYWTALKGKGKDYFISKLNEDGKAYYQTEEGKKYIDGIFA